MFVYHPDTFKTAMLSKKVSISNPFKRKINWLLSPFARLHNAHPLRRNLLKDNLESFAQYPLRISTLEYHCGRIAFSFS